jgi:SAM-dependent methyltransferase
MLRKGWFAIDGVQDGDRTAEEQLLGLAPAIEAAKGKSVLDLGCAEGLIAKAFCQGGARVVGIELVEDHLKVAREVCKGLAATFIQASLQEWIDTHPHPEQFDVVLALGIAHKLHDPATLLNFAARSAKELVVFRGPGKDAQGRAGSTAHHLYWDGWLKAKHRDARCHVPTLMVSHGFKEGETLPSARGERVQYWHK